MCGVAQFLRRLLRRAAVALGFVVDRPVGY
jgi:hypothetical protein